MYRKCKKIYLFWFGDVHGMEGNTIVLVLTCTVSINIEHCVVLTFTEIGRKQNCVSLGLFKVWKVIELCWFRVAQRMEGNNIVFVWVFTAK
jgi:hypothetical protein